MSDNYRVVVTVPTSLGVVASAIGRAMDIDVGGADSFVERDGQLVAETWANASFASMFVYLVDNPHGLYMAVACDFGERWPQLTPPDLSSIEAFCAAASVTVTGVGDA